MKKVFVLALALVLAGVLAACRPAPAGARGSSSAPAGTPSAGASSSSAASADTAAPPADGGEGWETRTSGEFEYKLAITDTHHIAILITNNTGRTLSSLEVKADYLSGGTSIEDEEATIYFIKPGQKVAIQFLKPVNSVYDLVEFDDVEVALQEVEAVDWVTDMSDGISYEHNAVEDGVFIHTTNSNTEKTATVKYHVLFYFKGEFVGIGFDMVDVAPGETREYGMGLPMYLDERLFVFDSYEVLMNEAVYADYDHDD